MSSTTTQFTAPDQSAFAPPIYWRFVWKEYRQLCGFWLAILVLTVIVQLILVSLSPATLPAAWLFAAALSAAALFVVAAAATTFAVEQDEGTYGYLSSLPTTWSPIFWGKLTPAVVGGLALAAAGTLSGLIAGGWRLPAALETSQVLAILAPALLEALAWGTFFSLTLRRPLLAAILTIAAASASAALIGAIIAPGAPIFYAETYLSVIAARLALAAVLLLLDTRLAKGWLTPRGALRSISSHRRTSSDTTAGPDQLQRHTVADGGRQSLRAELVPLIWQTWRESRAAMLVLLVTGATLVVLWFVWLTAPARAVTVLEWLGIVLVLAPLVSLLIMAPLAGVWVFLADQHRRQYQFLAEHAARPRYVWLARHAVWVGVGCGLALLAIGLILLLRLQPTLSLMLQQAFGSSPMQMSLHTYLRERMEDGFFYYRRDRLFDTFWVLYLSSWHSIAILTSVTIVMAYAAGQLASMMFRSGILAAVLAVVLTTVLAAWTWTLALWNLSVIWFGLPIAAGMLLATWLRAPDWIAHRNSLRTWCTPLAAVLLPAAAVVVALPAARLAQLQAPPEVEQQRRETLDKATADWRASDTPAARATARLYRETALQLTNAETAIAEDAEEGVTLRPAAQSKNSTDAGTPNGQGGGNEDSPRQETREMEPQQDEATRRKLAEAYGTSAARTIEISRRSECRFSLRDPYASHSLEGQLEPVDHLLVALAHAADDYLSAGNLDDCLQCNLAALRMLNHSRNGQGIDEWSYVDWRQREVRRRIAKWAAHKGQTSADLKDAIIALDRIWAVVPHPRTAVVASSAFIRDLIEEKRLPEDAAEMYATITGYLPHLANRLPWERKRALRILDAITAYDAQRICDLSDHLSAGGDGDPMPTRQALILPITTETANFTWPPFSWLATSYYLRANYSNVWRIEELPRDLVERTMWRRALKLQLALIAYQLDHGAYPDELEQLVPDYVDRLPHDPYTGELFWYRPEGFGIETTLGDAWSIWSHRVDSNDGIHAHTPIFWSVAYGVIRRPSTEVGIDLGGPEPEATSEASGKEAEVAEQHRKKVLYLHERGAYVFRLPKPADSE